MRRRLLACVALLCLPTYAHNYHQAMTAVEYNDRTQSLELVHTLVAHDLEAALIKDQGISFDLGQTGAEPVVRRYVEKHVVLRTTDGRTQAIDWVGYEVEAQQVRIYQELKHYVPNALSLSCTLLFDLHKNQRNTVNILMNGITTSKILSLSDQSIEVK